MLVSSKLTPCQCLRLLHRNTQLLTRTDLQLQVADHWRNCIRAQRCFATDSHSSLVDKPQKDAVTQKKLGEIGAFKADRKPKLREPLVPNLFLGKLDPVGVSVCTVRWSPPPAASPPPLPPPATNGKGPSTNSWHGRLLPSLPHRIISNILGVILVSQCYSSWVCDLCTMRYFF